METKINIAEILKDKPKGTKLYADAFGELSFDGVGSNKDEIIFTKTEVNTSWCFYNDGKFSKFGNPILVPSKEMRNWSKFAWKKGDVLVGVGQRIIFEKFIDENYTKFQGKYSLSTYEDRTLVADKKCYTSDFRKLDDNVNVKNYFKEIEERLGGKLNRETLEIEKTQPEFKDGANWAINEFLKSLWHDAEEEPKKKRVFLYKTIFEGYGINQIIDGNEWKYIIKYQRATQWLYIDDLLPKKGGYHD